MPVRAARSIQPSPVRTNTFADDLTAMMEEYNNVSSAIAYYNNMPDLPTEEELTALERGEWNPLDANKGSEFQSYEELNQIAKARNQRELDWIYNNIRRAKANREAIDQMGLGKDMALSVIAGISDPIQAAAFMMFPEGKAGHMLSKAGRASVAGMGSTAVAEVGLLATQPHREIEESRNYVLSAGVIGAMLGPLAKGITPEDRVTEASKKIQQMMTESSDETFMHSMSGNSVGARVVKRDRLPPGFEKEMDEKLLSGEITGREHAIALRDKELEWTRVNNPRLTKVLAFFSPAVRLATSKFRMGRELGESLFEDSLVRQANKFGYTTSDYSVETIIRTKLQPARITLEDINSRFYKEYADARSGVKASTKGISARNQNILTDDEFRDEVGKALSRGDEGINDEVTKAAKAIRKEIQKTEKELKDLGLLDVDAEGNIKIPSGDISYFPRVWNRDAILGDMVGFRNVVANAIKAQLGGDDVAKFADPGHMIEFNAALDETVRAILGSPLNRLDKNIVPRTGFLKGRTLKISSEQVQDYLVLDPNRVMYSYYRDIIPRIELTKKFGSFDLKEQLAAVDREATALLKEATTEKARKAINKQYMAVKRDIQAGRDLLLGTYGRPDDPNAWYVDTASALKTWNFLTSLGGMAVAAIPDYGQMALRNGAGKVMSQTALMATNIGKMNLSKAYLRKVGVALDLTLNSRTQAMFSMDDPALAGGMMTRFGDKATKVFSKATLMSHWNTGTQQIIGHLMIDDLAGKALGTRKIGEDQFRRMAQIYGIDKRMWGRISKEWKRHGHRVDGLRVPGWEKWADEEAARTLQSAINREAYTSVVHPGYGDLPLSSRNTIGKLVFQFKSFPLAATNRILLPAVHNADLMPVNMAASIFGVTLPLAAVSYYVKELAAGREPSTDLTTLTREAIDRSGIFAYLGDLNSITEKMTRGRVGLSALFGGEPLTRRASSSVVGDLLGPSFGKLGDVAGATGAAADLLAGDQITEGDIRRMRRLIPFQNLFYTRDLLNRAEENIAEQVTQ